MELEEVREEILAAVPGNPERDARDASWGLPGLNRKKVRARSGHRRVQEVVARRPSPGGAGAQGAPWVLPWGASSVLSQVTPCVTSWVTSDSALRWGRVPGQRRDGGASSALTSSRGRSLDDEPLSVAACMPPCVTGSQLRRSPGRSGGCGASCSLLHPAATTVRAPPQDARAQELPRSAIRRTPNTWREPVSSTFVALLALAIVLMGVGLALAVGLGYAVHRRPALATPVGIALTTLGLFVGVCVAVFQALT